MLHKLDFFLLLASDYLFPPCVSCVLCVSIYTVYAYSIRCRKTIPLESEGEKILNETVHGTKMTLDRIMTNSSNFLHACFLAIAKSIDK